MLAHVAAAAALVLPTTAVAAAPATVTRTYVASRADFANPGRGFFSYSETHLYADGTGWVPLQPVAGRSLAYRIFYLERYATTDTISAADLGRIRADFATARAAGMKVIVRFAYTATSDADAPLPRVLGQIGQLAPILRADADVVAAVQAGFIGRWGEWYYSQNFTAGDSAARGAVLKALLAATAPDTPVQVRTPQIRRTLAPAIARVGVHDDCFLAGTDDYGTYADPDDRDWLARQSFLVGGETCATSDRSGWANASAEMARYHWTYLNPSFDRDVLDSWGTAGLAEASRRLGYRLRLISSTLPRRASAGAPVTARLTLTNDGYAAPVQNRPVRLIVGRGSWRTEVSVPADVRTWAPGRTVTLTVRFTMPRGAGVATVALGLPDPAPSLAGRPAYAIRLADDGVWDGRRGWNVIGAIG